LPAQGRLRLAANSPDAEDVGMASLEPNRDGKYIIGVDIGGTFIKAAALDRHGHIVSTAKRDARAMEGVAATMGEVVEAARAVMADAGADTGQVCGVGMGVPGRHRSDQGICVYSPNFAGWSNVQVVAPVEEALGLATYMRNDVKTAALGEHRFGAGRGYRFVVMITLGTGIGGAAIIDGQLRLGSSEGFAEVGHMCVDPNGPRCGCGSHGCWEAFAGRDGVIDRGLRAVQSGRETKLADAAASPEGLTPRAIAEAAGSGDQVAQEVLAEIGFYLGVGIANLVQLYDPEIVIVGGGIAGAGEWLFGPMRRTCRARARMVTFDPKRIVAAELGDDAGVIGASVLVLEQMQA
jgi:glucokinase